jgi:hypothetical protein
MSFSGGALAGGCAGASPATGKKEIKEKKKKLINPPTDRSDSPSPQTRFQDTNDS